MHVGGAFAVPKLLDIWILQYMIDDSYMLLHFLHGVAFRAETENFLSQQRFFCSEKPFKILILALTKRILYLCCQCSRKLWNHAGIFLNRIFRFALERVNLNLNISETKQDIEIN